MTRSEFRERVEKLRKHDARVWLWTILAVVSVFVAMWAAFGYVESSGSVWPRLLVYLLTAAALAASIGGSIHYSRRWKQRNGVACPACGKAYDQWTSQIVIASGRCGYCGAPVLEDS
jgi:hypothetical protein